MGIAGLVSKAVAFLRAGYPTGAPKRGYVPLLALLRRRVTDDEITTITSEFMTRKAGPVSTVDVGVAIFRITNEIPSLDDIARVEQRLDAIGCARR
ncbi:DUF3349 domain-containing protein [Mycobacterium ahvazicum]|uniref:DUF3349 domain-containing protein n=1 Tax=Mycobacterium ahvazicum TaxID=1964395 RepID=A0A2K4YCD0_9MYCO|nr:DUF3349 domain-containing protein [Mycobacterium ahvazicum]SOX54450.1 DUF3349 domain-containing protein [Mycobacterium ahvazicum]